MVIRFEKFKKREGLKIFSSYFRNNKNKFDEFLNNLSEEKQEKFFRLSIFYRNFVKNPPIKHNFLKDIFSVLIIFSLIEALMEDKKYLTFQEFLKKNFKPINTKEKLEKIENEYYSQFGAIKKAKDFFEKHVDKDCIRIFVYAIRRRNTKKEKGLNKDKIIKRNIDLFYKWRSNFVHSAKFPESFQNYGIFKTGREYYSIPYKRKDFELLFEHGFLRYFGLHDNFEHGNIKKKIREYKKHTGIITTWES